eukprot:5229614-Prymnesium_polylepis.1
MATSPPLTHGDPSTPYAWGKPLAANASTCDCSPTAHNSSNHPRSPPTHRSYELRCARLPF